MTRWVYVAALVVGAVATGSRYGELQLGDAELDAVLAITGPGEALAKTVHGKIENVRENAQLTAEKVEKLAVVAAEREQRVERAESSATGSSDYIFQLHQDAKDAQAELQAAQTKHAAQLAKAEAEEKELLAGLSGSSIMTEAARMLQQTISEDTPLSGIEPALLTVASLVESEQRNAQREEARDAELCEANIAMADRKIAASKRETHDTAAVLKRREAALAGAKEELQLHTSDVEGVQNALDANHVQLTQLRAEVAAELESARLRDEEHNNAMHAATAALKALGTALDDAPKEEAKAEAAGKDMKFRRRRAQVSMAPAEVTDVALDAGSAPSSSAAADDWTAAVQWLQVSAGVRAEPWEPTEVSLRTPEEHAAAKSLSEEASDFERMLAAKRNAHALRQLVGDLHVSIADSDPEDAAVDRDRHLLHALEREHDRLQRRLDAAGDIEDALRTRVLTAQAFVSQATQRAADVRALAATQERFRASQHSPCAARRRASEAAAAHRAFVLHVVAEMTRAVRTFLASGGDQTPGAAARKAFTAHLARIEDKLNHPPATPAEQRAAAAAVLDRLKAERARLVQAEKERLATELCIYTSQRTDSVASIAERFGVSTEALRKANRGTASPAAAAAHAALAEYPPVGTRVVVPRASMDKTAQALCKWVPRHGLVHLVMHDTLAHMRAACGAEAKKYAAMKRAAAADPLHAVDEELYGAEGLFSDEPLRPLAATAGTGGAGQAIEANPYAVPFDAKVPAHLQAALDARTHAVEEEEEETGPVAGARTAHRHAAPTGATGASATGTVGDTRVPFVPGFSANGLGLDCDAFAEVDLGHGGAQAVARDLSAAPGVSVEAWVSMPELPRRGDLTVLVSAVAETAINPISRTVDGLGPYRTGLFLAVGPRPGHPADAHPVFVFGLRGAAGKPLMTELDGTAVHAGRWAHVVGTYDGRVQRLFVNGRLAAESHAQSGPVAFGWDAAHPGKVSTAARLRLLSGPVEATCARTTLSHVALWRTALPAHAVTAHAASRAATGKAALAAAAHRRAVDAGEAPAAGQPGARPVTLSAFYPLSAAGAGGARSVENAAPVPLSGAVEPAHAASMSQRAMAREAEAAQFGAGSVGQAGPRGIYVVGATGVHAARAGEAPEGAMAFSATGGFSVDSADLARRRREASVELAQAAAVAQRWAEELAEMGPEAKALSGPLGQLKAELNAVVEKQDLARTRMEQARVTMRDADLMGDTVGRDAAAKFVREREAALETMKEKRTHLENEIVGRHAQLVQLQKDAAAASLRQQAAVGAHARAVAKLQRLVAERRALSAQVTHGAMEAQFQRASESVTAAQRGMAAAHASGDAVMEATYLRRGQDATETARAIAETQNANAAVKDQAQVAAASPAASQEAQTERLGELERQLAVSQAQLADRAAADAKSSAAVDTAEQQAALAQQQEAAAKKQVEELTAKMAERDAAALEAQAALEEAQAEG